jgi:C-terminal processing protease CtpA/Prc
VSVPSCVRGVALVQDGSEAARLKIKKGDKILTIEGVEVRGKSVFDALDLVTKDDKTVSTVTRMTRR